MRNSEQEIETHPNPHWQHTYKRRGPTTHPDIMLERSVGYKYNTARKMHLPAGFIPIPSTFEHIAPQEVTVNEYFFRDEIDGERSLGVRIGLSVPFDAATTGHLLDVLGNTDEATREKIVGDIHKVYRTTNPFVVIHDAFRDFNPYEREQRDFHISMAARFHGETTTLVSLMHHGVRGNRSFGNDGTLHNDTEGMLDWSGALPYVAKLQSTEDDASVFFEGWIGETSPIDQKDPDSALLVFAGLRMHQSLTDVAFTNHKDVLLQHIQDKSLHKHKAGIEPYLRVRKKNHPRMKKV